MFRRTYFTILLTLIASFLSTASCFAAPTDTQEIEAIETRALVLCKELCAEDLGCRYLREDLEKEKEREGRNIQFNALALYVISTLGPKLTKTPETGEKLKELERLFDEHMKLEHSED